MAKKTAKGQRVMRTLLIDSGSQYVSKIKKHVITAAEEQGVKHELTSLSIADLQKAYDKGDASVVQGFDYVISSGSGKYRKSDAEMHRFVSEYIDKDATFLGVCHGAQQYAVAQGAKLEKTDYMHRGKRKSKRTSKDPLGKEISEEGEYGHHKWYLPSKRVGSRLEVIAESESPHTGEKFVEMYRVKGTKHYGVQFHAEMGSGNTIKKLFRDAANDNKIPSYAMINTGYRK